MRKKIDSRLSTAVMQNRRPPPSDAEKIADPRVALWRTLDYFPTPPWGARAGAELVLALDPRVKVVLEPACGEGHMAAGLADYFEVIASDVHAHTPETAVRDWLDAAAWPDEPEADFVMTNPPFAIAADFVRLGLRRARYGVALLLRIAFMEGIERHAILAGPDARLTQLATFSQRLPMTLGRWDVGAASATAYAWFIWHKEIPPQPPVWIAPGVKDRLWKADDATRFGWREPMPLFEGVDESAQISGTGEGVGPGPAPQVFPALADDVREEAQESRPIAMTCDLLNPTAPGLSTAEDGL